MEVAVTAVLTGDELGGRSRVPSAHTCMEVAMTTLGFATAIEHHLYRFAGERRWLCALILLNEEV